MTRTELYERVWKTPISKLALEFGVSGVTLASLCRKHDVPVPPRGYWAKLAAGRNPKRAKLPGPGADTDVLLPGGRATLRGQESNRLAVRAKQALEPVKASSFVPFPATLDGCEPIVKRTVAFFTAIEEKVASQAKRDEKRRRPGHEPEPLFVPRGINGRHQCSEDGCIEVLASLSNVEWIGRLLQAFIVAIRSRVGEVLPRSSSGKQGSRIAFNGHSLDFSLSEGFDKVLADSQSHGSYPQYDYQPLNVYKLKLRRARRPNRVFEWNRADLEEDVAGFAAKVISAIREDQTFQSMRAREEEEERERAVARAIKSAAWFSEQERIYKRRKARKDQAARALQVGEAMLQYEATLRALSSIEGAALTAEEGSGIRAWVALAREGLESPVEVLIAQLRNEIAAEDGPDWWPLEHQENHGER